MTDTTDDLVKQLRFYALRVSAGVHEDCEQAAARIEALTAENERLTEAYNSLGNKAVDQVAKMGTEIGRKDCEIDVLTADLTQSKREVERLRGALGFAMRTLEAEGFSDDGPTLTHIRAALAGDSHDQ